MRRSLMGIAVASMSVLLGSVPLAARSAVADPGQVEPVSGPSPFAHCRPGEIDSTLPAGAFEPMAAVNPTDPENVVAVWAQDRFRGLVAGVSLDGGSTWRQVVIPGFTRCTGGRFDYVDDAWVSFGPDGVVHVYGKVFDSSMTPSGAFATRSTDGGRTWSRPTQLMLETTPGDGNFSGGALATDPVDGDVVYTMVPKFGDGGGAAYFTRSVDGGRTWAAPRKVIDPGPDRLTTGHQLLVLPDRTVVDVFTLIDFRVDPQRPERYLAVARSTDHGRTWSEPETVHTLGSVGTTDPRSGAAVAGSSRILSDAAVDPQTGSIYLVWQDARWSRQRADAIALSVSADRGHTWTAPARVNATPSNIPTTYQQAFTPAVAVTAGGAVAVSYYDVRRDNPGTPLWTDRWLVRCDPENALGCTTAGDFAAERRLTERSFDALDAARVPATRSFDLSGYVGLAATGDAFLAVFPITRPAHPSVVVAQQVTNRTKGA